MGAREIKKVILFGIDGATWRVITPLLKEGKLPALNRMMREGSHGVLFCPNPVISPVSWTTIATGVPKEVHGIEGFGTKLSMDMRIVNSEDVNANTLWEIIEGKGKKCIVINWDITWPVSKKAKSIIAPGIIFAPGRRTIVHPEQELMLKFKRFLFAIKGKFLRGLFKIRFPEGLDERDFSLPVILNHFFEKDWDFFAVDWQSVNAIQHNHWKHFEPEFFGAEKKDVEKFGKKIQDSYIALDSMLGKILDCADKNTTVIVFSDHGFDRSDCHNYVKINENLFLRGNLLLRQLGFLRFYPAEYSFNIHLTQKIDWKNTKAYFYNDLDGLIGIAINLKGRERYGLVEKQAFKKTVEEIMQKLRELKLAETGQEIFTEIRMAGSKRPDIIFKIEKGLPRFSSNIMKDFMCGEVKLGEKNIGECFSTNIRWTGNHDNEGIFIINGAGIKKGFKTDAETIDLAPTVLYSLGLKIPAYFQGKVIDVFSKEWIEENPIEKANISIDEFKYERGSRRQSRMKKEDEKEIWNELRKSGYAV